MQWSLTLDAEQLASGESAEARHPGAVSDAAHAFALLENGLRHMSPHQ
ncbi:hypothetical protein AB0B89_12765 [Sphaerisporangium sp. NPDC049002]